MTTLEILTTAIDKAAEKLQDANSWAYHNDIEKYKLLLIQDLINHIPVMVNEGIKISTWEISKWEI